MSLTGCKNNLQLKTTNQRAITVPKTTQKHQLSAGQRRERRNEMERECTRRKRVQSAKLTTPLLLLQLTYNYNISDNFLTACTACPSCDSKNHVIFIVKRTRISQPKHKLCFCLDVPGISVVWSRWPAYVALCWGASVYGFRIPEHWGTFSAKRIKEICRIFCLVIEVCSLSRINLANNAQGYTTTVYRRHFTTKFPLAQNFLGERRIKSDISFDRRRTHIGIVQSQNQMSSSGLTANHNTDNKRKRTRYPPKVKPDNSEQPVHQGQRLPNHIPVSYRKTNDFGEGAECVHSYRSLQRTKVRRCEQICWKFVSIFGMGYIYEISVLTITAIDGEVR